jgi:hypothetical protein
MPITNIEESTVNGVNAQIFQNNLRIAQGKDTYAQETKPKQSNAKEKLLCLGSVRKLYREYKFDERVQLSR